MIAMLRTRGKEVIERSATLDRTPEAIRQRIDEILDRLRHARSEAESEDLKAQLLAVNQDLIALLEGEEAFA